MPNEVSIIGKIGVLVNLFVLQRATGPVESNFMQ